MTNKQILKAQKYSQKIMMRLMNEFYDHLKTITDINQVDSKLQELNDKWLEHCSRTPEMSPEGKGEFLRLAGQALTMLEAEVIKKSEQFIDDSSASI